MLPDAVTTSTCRRRRRHHHRCCTEYSQVILLPPLLLLLPLICCCCCLSTTAAIGVRAWRCPDRCRCDEAEKAVQCVGLGLTSAAQIGHVPPDTRHLDVSNNTLTDLNFTALVARPDSLRLQTLSVRHNELQSLPVVSGLSGVVRLDVSHNLLSSLQLDSIREVSNVSEIDASSNQLTAVFTTTATFTTAHVGDSLRTLNLADNRLTNHHLAQTKLHQLTGLRSLDLSRNSVTSPADAHFLSPAGDSLAEVILSGNGIVTWSVGWLESSPSLTLLALDGNNIDTVSPEMWTRTVLTSKSNNTRVNISTNPFHCRCQLRWFTNWLRTNINSTQVEVVNIHDSATFYRCQAPAHKTNLTLLQYQPTDKDCPQHTKPTTNKFGIVAMTFLGLVSVVTLVGFLGGITYFSKRNREVIYTNIN